MDNRKWKIINKKFFLSLSILHFSFYIFVTGCGYKPSTEYQSKIFGKKIKPVVEIDIKNPRESIFLKDAINDAIYTFLNEDICYNNCDSIMKINSHSSSLEVLDYDENGYPLIYRSTVQLSVTIIDKSKVRRNYNVTGIYDFKVESQGVLNDEARLNAYKNASINALNKLFALIAKDGAYK